MESNPILYLARGYPGSGRTTACERLRQNNPIVVFLSADPMGQDEQYSSAEARSVALAQAAEEIRDLVAAGCKMIAVETCAPTSREVMDLVESAVAAKWTIKLLPPSCEDAADILACADRSAHRPTAALLSELCASWEDVCFNRAEAPQYDYKNTWQLFTRAMAAETFDESQRIMQEIYENHPYEAGVLHLDTRPTWARFPTEEAPVKSALSDICPYWAKRDAGEAVAYPKKNESHANPIDLFAEEEADAETLTRA